MKNKTRELVLSALIGAIYATLTLVGAGFAYGPIQFRFSEALCVLPYFIPGSVWGLTAGCALANVFGGYGLIDVVFGSLATLAAGLIASRIRRRVLVPLPAVLINAAVVGATLAYSYVGTSAAFWGVFAWNALTVGAGQLGACYALGLPLLYALPRIEPLQKYLDLRSKKTRKNDK